MLEVKGLLLTKTKQTNKQTNKNHPVGEKQTGWLASRQGRAGQGRTQTTSNIR